MLCRENVIANTAVNPATVVAVTMKKHFHSSWPVYVPSRQLKINVSKVAGTQYSKARRTGNQRRKLQMSACLITQANYIKYPLEARYRCRTPSISLFIHYTVSIYVPYVPCSLFYSQNFSLPLHLYSTFCPFLLYLIYPYLVMEDKDIQEVRIQYQCVPRRHASL